MINNFQSFLEKNNNGLNPNMIVNITKKIYRDINISYDFSMSTTIIPLFNFFRIIDKKTDEYDMILLIIYSVLTERKETLEIINKLLDIIDDRNISKYKNTYLNALKTIKIFIDNILYTNYNIKLNGNIFGNRRSISIIYYMGLYFKNKSEININNFSYVTNSYIFMEAKNYILSNIE